MRPQTRDFITGALAARLQELAAGRARVEEFSARRMVDQLADLYTRLVDARASRGSGK